MLNELKKRILAKKAKIVTGSEMPPFFASKLKANGGNPMDSILARFGGSVKVGGVTIATEWLSMERFKELELRFRKWLGGRRMRGVSVLGLGSDYAALGDLYQLARGQHLTLEDERKQLAAAASALVMRMPREGGQSTSTRSNRSESRTGASACATRIR